MFSNQFGKKPNQSPDKGNQALSFSEADRRSFAHLVAFLQAAEGFTLGFIESNFAKDIDAILAALKENPACDNIQWEILTFNDPNLRFLRDGLVEALRKVTIQTGKRLVLVVRGLEYSIGLSGDYPPMLQDLNFVRDDLLKSVPYPLIFCLPDYAITRLARFAPDLWAWKSGLFRFQSSHSIQLEIVEQVLEDNKIRGGLELQEKQERIDLLQRLLMESRPSGHTPTSGDRKRCADILRELGVLYRSIGDVVKSENSFKEGLALLTDDVKLASIKASLYHELGVLYQNLGHIESAIALYKQSLELDERIGDVQGKAATLHQMASIYANQGDVEQAIALYKQSLELKERIGNVQGKAATLAMLGQLVADTKGEYDTAIQYLQQSLGILQRLKSPDAKTVQSILDRITQNNKY